MRSRSGEGQAAGRASNSAGGGTRTMPPYSPPLLSTSAKSPVPVVRSTIASFVIRSPARVWMRLSPVRSTTEVVGVSMVRVRLVPVNEKTPETLPRKEPVAQIPIGDAHVPPDTDSSTILPCTFLHLAAAGVPASATAVMTQARIAVQFHLLRLSMPCSSFDFAGSLQLLGALLAEHGHYGRRRVPRDPGVEQGVG